MEKPYTNADIYSDVVSMLNEVQYPTDEVKKLLKAAEYPYYMNKNATNSPAIEALERYFYPKYQLLFHNCDTLFKIFILKRRKVELDLLQNILTLENAIEKGLMTPDKAAITFGLQNARKYFPKEVMKEVETNMNDPHKLKNYIKKAKKIQSDSN